MTVEPKLLRVPMYALSRMNDIEAFVCLAPEQLGRLSVDYTPREVSDLVDALQFARDNPTYDFLALQPELPFSNAQIHRYLCAVLRSVESALPR